VTEQDYTVARAAASLRISDKTLHTWVTLARNQSDGVLSDDERTALKQLRKENKALRLEKEILKKASAFFAKHMS
jgi:transposase